MKLSAWYAPWRDFATSKLLKRLKERMAVRAMIPREEKMDGGRMQNSLRRMANMMATAQAGGNCCGSLSHRLSKEALAISTAYRHRMHMDQ